jgi:hypothetical protein
MGGIARGQEPWTLAYRARLVFASAVLAIYLPSIASPNEPERR